MLGGSVVRWDECIGRLRSPVRQCQWVLRARSLRRLGARVLLQFRVGQRLRTVCSAVHAGRGVRLQRLPYANAEPRGGVLDGLYSEDVLGSRRDVRFGGRRVRRDHQLRHLSQRTELQRQQMRERHELGPGVMRSRSRVHRRRAHQRLRYRQQRIGLRHSRVRLLRDDALLHLLRPERHVGRSLRRRASLAFSLQAPEPPDQSAGMLHGIGGRRAVHGGERQLRHHSGRSGRDGQLWDLQRAPDMWRCRHGEPMRMLGERVRSR